MKTERFVDRHPSMLRALLAHGMLECDARALAESARLAGKDEVRMAAFGRSLIVRRKRGGHADVYELLEV